MSILDLLLGKPTLKSVTLDVAKELRARGETDLAVDTADGSVQVRREGSAATVINVHNLLQDLLGLPRSQRAARVRQFLGGMPIGEMNLPTTWEDAVPLLRPIARYEHEFGLHSLLAQVQTGTEMKRVARRPAVNDLVAALAIDMPETLSVVTEETLAGWGVSFEQAFEQATLNLRGHTPPEGWRAIGPGVWSGEWGDSYESPAAAARRHPPPGHRRARRHGALPRRHPRDERA